MGIEYNINYDMHVPKRNALEERKQTLITYQLQGYEHFTPLQQENVQVTYENTT
jgi:hypothetical protein